MLDSAAPQDAGRRPAFGTAFVMAAFLFVAPPLFLLAPLCFLLLFSRPLSGRVWFWILATAAAAGYSLVDAARAPAGDGRLVAAFGLFSGATFLALTHAVKTASPVSRALIAVGVSACAVLLWTRQSGLDLAQLDALFEASLRASIPLALKDAPASQLNAAIAAIPMFVRLIPGFMGFQALVGLGLAWRWYLRIASGPGLPPLRPFRNFRFSDPLIWGAIFTIGLSLVPLGPDANRAIQCLLVVWVGVYATRGLAVVAAATETWSLPGRILLLGLSFLAFPVAFGSVVTLGLADVWVDFRRRAALNSGGKKPDGSDSAGGREGPR